MALSASDVKKLFQDDNLGILIIRLVMGAAIIAAGIPKFMNGPDALREVGSAMSYIGVNFAPLTFGFLAALAEIVGGFMIMLGFLFRPAAALLTFVMIMASIATAHNNPDGIALPISYAGVFLGLLFTGPNKFSVQKE